MTAPLSWVVGAGGLLGSNTVHALERRGPVWRPATPVDWRGPDAAEQLEDALASFVDRAAGADWQIAWCAGAGVTGASPEQLSGETTLFDRFLDAAQRLPPDVRRNGALFLASSAGGVYAGSPRPPFDERSPVRPISPYGEAKLQMERAATAWSAASRVPVVIGRIANLYGPGQDLAKPQGLLSQICKAHLQRRPLSIYVPLDTVRDYLFAPDCGGMVADCLEWIRRRRADDAGVHIKVLASQQGVTVAAVVGELRRVLKRPLRIVYGSSPSAKFQIRDLRLRSVVMTDVDARRLTPLPAGMRATIDDLSRTLQAGVL